MELIQEAIQLVLASNISSKALIVNKLQQVSSMVHQKDIKIKDLEHQVKIQKDIIKANGSKNI